MKRSSDLARKTKLGDFFSGIMSCAEVMYHPYPYLAYHSAMSPRSSTATGVTSSMSNHFSTAATSVNQPILPSSSSLTEHCSSFSSKKYSTNEGNLMSRPVRPQSMQDQSHISLNGTPSNKYMSAASGNSSTSSPPASAAPQRTNSDGGSHENGGGSSSSSHVGSPSVPPNSTKIDGNGMLGAKVRGESTSCALPSSPGRESNGRGAGRGDGGDSNFATDALYVSANCVLFTYYNGDVSAAVDEHINKALSQNSSTSRHSIESNKVSHSKEISPMSQRNFPPSFWNSNYHMSLTSGATGSLQNHHAAAAAVAAAADLSTFQTDPYHHHHHHHHHPPSASSLHSLHHQTDPWSHYSASLSSQAYSHRAAAAASMHDLATAAAAASYTASGMSSVAPPPPSAPNSRYSSLLIQPSMRSSRLAPVHGQCSATGLGKPEAAAAAAAWGAHRYHHDALSNELSPHLDGNYNSTYGSMGGMTDYCMYGMMKFGSGIHNQNYFKENTSAI